MSKAAAKKTTSQGVIEEGLEQMAASVAAKQQFLASTFNMSWRLAITVVIPIVAGVKLDDHFRTAPSLTLLGFMIAATAGCATVWRTVKELNRQQVEDDAVKAKKPKRRVKRV